MSLPDNAQNTSPGHYSPRSFLVDSPPPAAKAAPASAPPAAAAAASAPPLVQGMSRRAVMVGLVGALFVSAMGGGAVGAGLSRTTAPAVSQAAAPTAAAPVQPASSSVAADVYRKVVPTVVQVTANGAGFFGSSGTGSGFIIDKDGSAITNNHVVENARSLSVTMADGKKYPAKIVGRSPQNDVALIKIDAPGVALPVVEMGDSAAVQPGDIAIAIGSPLGLDKTVTSGIVSAINRDMTTWQVSLKGLIQTDAAINPGNSGGPLLNDRGQAIGINTLGAAGISGIGFAVPINTVKQLLPQLKAGTPRP